MADSIFTSETPLVDGDTSPVAVTRSLAMRFTCSAAGQEAVSGGVWVPSFSWPAIFIWQLWQISGTPTLLSEVDTHTLSAPTLGAWMLFPMPAAVPLSTTETYAVRVFTSGGLAQFVYSYGQTLPVGSGGVISSDRCMEDLNGASTDPPATVGSSDFFFFANVFVEPEVEPITATFALVLPTPVGMSLTADADINSTLALTLPSPAAAFEADADISAALALTLPSPALELTSDADIGATLALTIPETGLSLTGDADIAATLSLTLPDPEISLGASAITQATLALTLPILEASFTVSEEAEPDLSYYTVITSVGQCAVDAINAATPASPLARVCLHVAGQIAFDDCQCGSFTQTAGPWLWSANGRTSTSYIGDDNICGPPYLGLQVTAVVLRCAAQPDDDDLAPTCAALDADAQQWHIDSSALRRGIVCCLQAMRAAGTIESFEVVSHVARGPEGMCVGSELTYRIWLPNCDCG